MCRRVRLLALVVGAILSAIVFWDLFRSETIEQPSVSITILDVAGLPGWKDDAAREAVVPFLRSCTTRLKRAPEARVIRSTFPEEIKERNLYGTSADWQEVCRKAIALVAQGEVTDSRARAFFEQQFDAFKIEKSDEEPKFTGYFEPAYQAREIAEPPYIAPILTRPVDLISVDLGQFDDSLKGKRIAGRVEGTQLIPYPDHQGIAENPPITAKALAYMDPNDLLFLQIQGSGRLVFPDGVVHRVGYAAQNGRDYVAIGRTLINDGELTLENVSMQSIYEWLENAPAARAAAVRYSNPSYVFFRLLDGLPDPAMGPLGAEGVQLTPLRSLAVDPSFYPYGAPVWLDAEETDTTPAQRSLFVAQDTGGAIRGAQRGDIFFGPGEAAAQLAGYQNAPGTLFVLVPKSASQSNVVED